MWGLLRLLSSSGYTGYMVAQVLGDYFSQDPLSTWGCLDCRVGQTILVIW